MNDSVDFVGALIHSGFRYTFGGGVGHLMYVGSLMQARRHVAMSSIVVRDVV